MYVLANGAVLGDLGARFKVKPGDDMFHPVKNYPAPWKMFAEAAANNCIPYLSRVNKFPWKTIPYDILALAEVCALWVLSS